MATPTMMQEPINCPSWGVRNICIAGLPVHGTAVEAFPRKNVSEIGFRIFQEHWCRHCHRIGDLPPCGWSSTTPKHWSFNHLSGSFLAALHFLRGGSCGLFRRNACAFEVGGQFLVCVWHQNFLRLAVLVAHFDCLLQPRAGLDVLFLLVTGSTEPELLRSKGNLSEHPCDKRLQIVKFASNGILARKQFIEINCRLKSRHGSVRFVLGRSIDARLLCLRVPNNAQLLPRFVNGLCNLGGCIRWDAESRAACRTRFACVHCAAPYQNVKVSRSGSPALR